MRKQKGFSLVEVLVASVIFFLVMAGLSGVFISGNKLIIHARERMASAQLGKFFLDPLQADVRQDTWDCTGASSCGGIVNRLNVSSAQVSFTSQTVNSRPFSATYTVADGTIDSALAGTDLRRVSATITWDEHS